jgi:hypothetical protein
MPRPRRRDDRAKAAEKGEAGYITFPEPFARLVASRSGARSRVFGLGGKLGLIGGRVKAKPVER